MDLLAGFLVRLNGGLGEKNTQQYEGWMELLDVYKKLEQRWEVVPWIKGVRGE